MRPGMTVRDLRSKSCRLRNPDHAFGVGILMVSRAACHPGHPLAQRPHTPGLLGSENLK